MATFDVTKKLEIYHTLYRLNRSFAAIVAHCQTLEATRFFRPSPCAISRDLRRSCKRK